MFLRLAAIAILSAALVGCPEDSPTSPSTGSDASADSATDAAGSDVSSETGAPDTSEPDVGTDTPATPDVEDDTPATPDVEDDTPATPDVEDDTPATPDVEDDTPATPDVVEDLPPTPDVEDDTPATPDVEDDTPSTPDVVEDLPPTPDVGGDATGPPDVPTSDIGSDANTDTAETQLQALIAAARAAGTDGTTGTWTVNGALVTGTRSIGNAADQGFYVQGGPTGPAVFVREAPDSLPALGDEVLFDATELDITNGAVHVMAYTGLTTVSSGNDLTSWIQDVSAVDFAEAGALEDLESELITISGAIAGGFAFAGSGYRRVPLVTDGDLSGDIALRMPDAVRDAVLVDSGGDPVACFVDLAAYPLGRFNATPQPTAFDILDVGLFCPPPFVLGAYTIGPDKVVVEFGRPIEASSITDAATQFLFDGGLTATFAGVGPGPNAVTVTLDGATDAQVTYTVSVTETITDTIAQGVDPAANTASFSGFEAPELILINEVDADTVGADVDEFVELYNPGTEDVDLDGYTLVLINGSNLNDYGGGPLSGVLPAGGYALIASQDTLDASDVASLEFSFESLGDSYNNGYIQNGPDAVAIVKGGIVVDALSYEGAVTGYVEGTAAVDDDSTEFSLQRCGVDTDDNSVDFRLEAAPTPGAANTCL